jgi:hypothetical protein
MDNELRDKFEEMNEEIKEVCAAFLPERTKMDVSMHWYAGRVMFNSDLYQRYSKGVVKALAKSRGVTPVTIYREIKFYEMFPNLEVHTGELDLDIIRKLIPENKNLSWFYLVNNILVVKNTETQQNVKVTKRLHNLMIRQYIEQKGFPYIALLDGQGKKVETIEILYENK